MKRISSNVIIEDIIDYNIQTFNFIPKAPSWIIKAIGLLGSNAHAKTNFNIKCKIVDYKIILPFEVDNIISIYDSGKLIYRTEFINPIHTYTENVYSRLDNTTLKFNVTDIEVYINYNGYIYEYDDFRQLYFPYIIDDERLKEYLKWYIFYRMLASGIKHEVYRLGHNDKNYDPGYLVEKYRTGAINALYPIDDNARKTISNILTTMSIVNEGLNI